MKVVISLRPLKSGSKTRGIGVYTRELVAALTREYPNDTIIPTSHDFDNVDADLVHLPYFDPYFLTLPYRLSHPTIVTIHDLIPLRFPTHFPAGIRGKVKWFVQSRLVRQAKHIITDSESSKRDIVSILRVSADYVTVVPLGPNHAERVPPAQGDSIAKKYNLPDRYILYVGDINWNKNVSGLIEMFAGLKDSRVHLVLVGSAFGDKPDVPDYRAIRQAIEKSGKSDKIHELGYAPSHHLSVLYSRATLYVQPSWYEGYGLPILEAMMFGCPVASSKLGSLPEVGGDAVAYFDPAHDMGEVVARLLASSPERKSLAAAGPIRAKNFTWERTARETHAVYEKTLASIR